MYIKDLKKIEGDVELTVLPDDLTLMAPYIKSILNKWLVNGTGILGPLLRYACGFKGLITVEEASYSILKCSSSSKQAVVCLENDHKDEFSEITIDGTTMKLIYDIKPIPANGDLAIYLKLKSVEYKNAQSRFNKSINTNHSAISLFNNHHKASLNVHSPINLGVFTLPYEEYLKDFLLQIKLPTPINELYEEIVKIVGPLNSYPTVDLRVVDLSQGPIERPTDIIGLKEGQLTDYMRTNREVGYFISLLPNGKYEIALLEVPDIDKGSISTALDATCESIRKDDEFIKKYQKRTN